jgi:O-antigen ligase
MSESDLIGTIGVGLLLIAYFLNMFSWIKKDGVGYFVLNIIGGSIACYASIIIDFVPFIILEGTWAIVSVFGLLKVIKKPQA